MLMNIANRQSTSRRLLIGLFVAGSCLLATQPSRADEDADRERLAKISYELQQLRLMIEQADKNSDKTARVRFRYDWLNRDVEMVQRGIDDHLDAPRQPRPVAPLRGDYRN